MGKGYYRVGFWMKPHVTYQCASCGVKFGSTYPHFIECCSSCGAKFIAYVEESKEV